MSSEIEGEVLDTDQVRSSIARRLGIDIGALTPADRHVEGIVEMMLDATGHYTAPLTAETKGMFNLDAFRQMKRTGILINVTRGEIVDHASLIQALKEQLIAAISWVDRMRGS